MAPKKVVKKSKKILKKKPTKGKSKRKNVCDFC